MQGSGYRISKSALILIKYTSAGDFDAGRQVCMQGFCCKEIEDLHDKARGMECGKGDGMPHADFIKKRANPCGISADFRKYAEKQ